jgi:hypothetical protein
MLTVPFCHFCFAPSFIGLVLALVQVQVSELVPELALELVPRNHLDKVTLF